mgnify:CR=1 FL=1
MNILLTSVGRRNYLVDYFKEAVKPHGGKIYAINSSEDSIGLVAADESQVSPLIHDSSYNDFLIQYCLKHEINCIIPLFDIDLPILSKLKKKLNEIDVTTIVADYWMIEIANDKWKTQKFLRENNFNTVPSFLSPKEFLKANAFEESTFPVFVKPRWGMGSISVFKAETKEELHFFFKQVKKEIKKSYLKYESAVDIENAVIIQEKLPGLEYGLDIINDLNGTYQTTIVKNKIAMRSGETDSAVIVNDPILKRLGERIGRISKHPGNMDVDVFFDGKMSYILEMNPRFGGGYPFSHSAGVNLPAAIVNWQLGKKVDIKKLLSARIGTKSIKGIQMINMIGP